jgi:hypothetical protein
VTECTAHRSGKRLAAGLLSHGESVTPQLMRHLHAKVVAVGGWRQSECPIVQNCVATPAGGGAYDLPAAFSGVSGPVKDRYISQGHIFNPICGCCLKPSCIRTTSTCNRCFTELAPHRVTLVDAVARRRDSLQYSSVFILFLKKKRSMRLNAVKQVLPCTLPTRELNAVASRNTLVLLRRRLTAVWLTAACTRELSRNRLGRHRCDRRRRHHRYHPRRRSPNRSPMLLQLFSHVSRTGRQ